MFRYVDRTSAKSFVKHWPGATKAVDEFFDGKSETIIKSPLTDLYYTVKE